MVAHVIVIVFWAMENNLVYLGCYFVLKSSFDILTFEKENEYFTNYSYP